MSRTVNRNATQVPVNKLDEKYENFNEFHGLCDNKNYLGVDQQTFEDCNNVYVDQSNQLSSRPPLKQIAVLPVDEHVLKVFVINSTRIYHTVTSNNVNYIRFKYGENDWAAKEVSAKINIMWFDDKYVVFSSSSIFAFNFVYDVSVTVRWFDVADVVYTPIVKIVSGSETKDFESPNLFTNFEITRYLLDMSKVNSTSGIMGNPSVITVGDETFDIFFVENNELVFTKLIGFITATTMYVSKKQTYLVNGDFSNYYYSVDGNIFYKILLPEKQFDDVHISDDGLALYTNCRRDADSAPNVMFFVCSLTLQLDDPASVTSGTWVKKAINKQYSPDATLDMNLLTGSLGTGNGMTSTRYSDMTYSNRYGSFFSSPESGSFYGIYPVNVVTKTYNNNSNTFSATGIETSKTIEQSILVQINGTEVLVETLSDLFDPQQDYYGDFAHRRPCKITCSSTSFFNLIIISGYFGMTSQTLSVYYYFQITQNKYIYHAYRDDNGLVYRYSRYSQMNIPTNFAYDTLHSESTDDYLYSMLSFIDSSGDVATERLKSALIVNSGTDDKQIIFSTYLSVLYDVNSYSDIVSYSSGSSHPHRSDAPLDAAVSSTSTNILKQNVTGLRLYSSYSVSSVLTNDYFYYGLSTIPLLKRDINPKLLTILPLYAMARSIIYSDLNENDIQRCRTGDIYSNSYAGQVTVDITTNKSTSAYNYYVPNLTEQFTTNAIAIANQLYTSVKKSINDKVTDKDKYDVQAQLYFPVTAKVSFANEITALTRFDSGFLAIFLANEVYTVSSTDSADVYLLNKTKLLLGCKQGSDVLVNYDGKTVFLTTLKGLNALSYQDFVQSTSQVYNYLTENIMYLYDTYATSPIKLCQYKNWVFMYKTNSPEMLLFDARSASWWRWTVDRPVEQLYDDNGLMMLANGNLYKFDVNANDYFDFVGSDIPWSFTSQKLHFKAPNNYKHVRSLTFMNESEDNDKLLTCKLSFKNYRNFNNLPDSEVIEYDIKDLSIIIERVNFLKTNAFQFTVSSEHAERPSQFNTANIAIKYRITERLR